ncbi:MAG: dihydrofolate reductase [Ginsengibacter sp.]
MNQSTANDYLIAHLVAVSENNVIGNGNQIPWYLPDDFKYFKNKTWGLVVIMGRKTFESMGKELPGRINIIITRDKNWKQDNVLIAHDLQSAISLAKSTDCKEIFIIGGGEIFKQSLDHVNRLYITRVHANVEGDITYPPIDEDNFQLVSSDLHSTDDKHKFAFTFQIWERKHSINN